MLVVLEERGRRELPEPCGEAHVRVVLFLIVPDQQFLPDLNVQSHHEVEVVVVLCHAQVLLQRAASTLNKVHPVTIFRVTGINEICKSVIFINLQYTIVCLKL